MIDTHVHLQDPAFDLDREAVLARALSAGVEVLVTLGTDRTSSERAVELAERFEGVYAAVGIHPTQAHQASPGDLEALARLAVHPKVVAVGECGLDYERGWCPPKVQWENLRRHVRLSRDCGKPLVLHNRGAHEDLLRILEEEGAQQVVLHMFTGPAPYADRCGERGYWMSVGGVITYPAAKSVREAVARIPETLLLLETDSPYMSPHPIRGKRNEPANLLRVVEAVAAVRGENAERVGFRTAENARRCFGL